VSGRYAAWRGFSARFPHNWRCVKNIALGPFFVLPCPTFFRLRGSWWAGYEEWTNQTSATAFF